MKKIYKMCIFFLHLYSILQHDIAVYSLYDLYLSMFAYIIYIISIFDL